MGKIEQKLEFSDLPVKAGKGIGEISWPLFRAIICASCAVFRISIYCYFFKPERLECEWGKKMGTKFAYVSPPYKNRGKLVEMSVGIFHATPRFEASVYFLPGGDRPSGHIKGR